MRVRLKPDRFYRAFADPWSIGSASSPRYDHYRNLILEHVAARGCVLDIGCGYGSFLARLSSDFDELSGLDASKIAIDGASLRHPHVRFVHGSAEDPPAELGERRYDLIILSDVLYYLPDRKRRAAISWIADHLADEGIAFIAAWTPGGRYLTHDELARLVDRELVIRHYELLESGHCVLVAEPRTAVVALTVDYETWQPIPEGRKIDWNRDVLQPTEALLKVASSAGVPITLMAEMGEYLWLCEHDRVVAEGMREQWRAAIRAGHDVQLHLHPNWLPELGARHENGEWSWDWSVATAAGYPGDLAGLISRCRHELEDAIRPVDRDYRVTAFRAGTYEAQPFARLHDALLANGITSDTSVLPGGHRTDRRYDYRRAAARFDTWNANRFDPQLRGPISENGLVELPVCTIEPGKRWTFDRGEGARFVERLRRVRAESAASIKGSSEQYRLRRVLGTTGRDRRLPLATALARRFAVAQHRPRGDDVFVLVGHTKADLDLEAIERGFRELVADRGLKCVTLSAAARSDHRSVTPVTADEAEAASRAAASAVSRLIPLDRREVAVIGAQDDVTFLARALPWAEVSAQRRGTEAQAVVLAKGLEREADPTQALTSALGKLTADGVLLCHAWADGEGGWRAPSASPYAPTRFELTERMHAAGFEEVEVRELDAVRMLGLPLRPEASGRLLLARAWPVHRLPGQRLTSLVDHLYARIAPELGERVTDPLAILSSGRAWCAGYAAVLAEALSREGIAARRATLVAHGHPSGRGPLQRETHEVVEAWDGERLSVLDPTTGVVFGHALAELLADPELAVPNRAPDARWRERHYELYATSFLYSRVVAVGIREDPMWPPRFVSPGRVGIERPTPRGVPFIDRPPMPRTILRAWWLSHVLGVRSRWAVEDVRRRLRRRGHNRTRSEACT